MSHIKKFQKLPARCVDPRKRKRHGRGRFRKGDKKKGRRTVIAESSSSGESPMKRITFDLTAFSDDEDEAGLSIRIPTPPESEAESEAESGEGTGDEAVDELFEDGELSEDGDEDSS